MAEITNIEESNVKTFSCFSRRLCHEITRQLGIVPINRFVHSNGKIANVFIMTPQLSEFLKKWKENNPKKEGAKWKN